MPADHYQGLIYPARTAILRHAIGEAKLGDKKFELSTNMNGSLIIRSSQTGRYFTLPWDVLLDLAIEAGIEDADSEPGDEKITTKS